MSEGQLEAVVRKKGAYGGEIRYQLRIQCYTVRCDFDKETVKVSGVSSIIISKNKWQQQLSIIN